jgi:3-oxoacyl-[acyl-carrier-protein] synthase-1/3-oxoacyl-[acyl-carrier-protein] synthase II
MSGAAVIAKGAVSALGIGSDAYRAAFEGEPARVALATDAALSEAKLRHPFCGRAPADLGALPPRVGDDRAAALLACALGQALTELERVRPGFRGERLGVAIGTSSGGMLSAERFFAARAAPPASMPELARGATYFAPLAAVLDAFGLGAARARAGRATQVLAACAASTIAMGLGVRWLERGACDVVIAGGYDGVSVFVASGFEALRATTASRPRPFRTGRDGMSLGEGAGVVALVRDDDLRGARPFVFVAGFGASTDAVHITAPDRTGSGLARAATAALDDAAMPASRIDLVSAHATATPFNDAMESRALASVLEDRSDVPVHPFKAQIGHTLGAAGVLESLAAADAMACSIAPAAASSGELDPDAPALLLERGERRELRAALKLSAAFGGANAALVLSQAPSARPRRAPRPVHLRGGAHVTRYDLAELSAATGIARERLARLDELGRLGMTAVAALAESVGREALRGAGIVAGHGLATLDTNDRFDARKRERGATNVEPRVFPATSPNAVAGEAAIAFGLTGPSFAVGAGLDGGTEALAAGTELVAAGDASRVVVLAVDDAGPAARDLLAHAGLSHRALAAGAVALLLDASGEGAAAEIALDRAVDHDAAPIGHLALLRLLTS